MDFHKKVAAIIAKKFGIGIVSFRSFLDKAIIEGIGWVRKRVKFLMNDVEAVQLVNCLVSTLCLDGSVAEVGCFEGGSAALMAMFDQVRPIHAFDSFKGLPATGKDDSFFEKGNFTGSYQKAFDLVSNFRNVTLTRGTFPESAGMIQDKNFAFVHLDVDLFEGTLSCLNFFYPKMVRSGIILVHDYPSSEGVNAAINTFFEGKPEIVVKLSGNQAMIVKT